MTSTNHLAELVEMSVCLWFIKVLDAVSLEERFRKALPMLSRQIEGLKLLQKSRKMSPDTDKRVTRVFHKHL